MGRHPLVGLMFVIVLEIMGTCNWLWLCCFVSSASQRFSNSFGFS